MAPDMSGLLRDFRHPDGIPRGIKIRQRRRVMIQLVAEHEYQVSHESNPIEIVPPTWSLRECPKNPSNRHPGESRGPEHLETPGFPPLYESSQPVTPACF
jgi:hypothetical protein